MEELQNLRDEINRRIEPQKESVHPPFSYEELIAMCLALHDEPMEPRAIMAWITKTFFEYYCYAFGYFWTKLSGAYDDDGEESTAERFMKGFMVTFRKFEFPVKKSHGGSDDITEMLYLMSPNNVRRVLKSHPYENRKGTFRILDLPIELRTKIYDMALEYPQTGVVPPTGLRSDRPTAGFTVLSRDYAGPFSFKKWSADGRGQRLDLSTNTLSLLLVNKQVYKEALPCFYGLNVIYLGSLWSSLGALRLLPPSRSPYIRHLAFKYIISDRSSARTFFDMVCALPSLRKLDIWMNQRTWFNTYRSERGDTFTTSTIPGLDILTERNSGITINFSGECPDLAAYWKPKIEGLANVQTPT